MNSTYWYVHGHWFRRQFVHLAPGVGAPSQRVLRRRQKSQARSDFLAYAAAAADVAAGAVETALDGPGDGSGLNSSIWMAKGAAAMARVQPAGDLGTWGALRPPCCGPLYRQSGRGVGGEEDE